MSGLTRCLASALIFMYVAAAPTAQAQEQSVPIKDAPAAVLRAASGRFPQATIVAVAKEMEEGKELYEVTMKQAGRNIDVTATPAGTLTLIEREIRRAELPAPVARLLATQYGGATYRRFEEVVAVQAGTETLSFYEVLLVDAKTDTLEVEIAPDGSRILKIEKKRPGDTD
ncbi:MAG TPA: hypothetical protein VFT29_06740 [Gemmatimonadaceae bacterium]|nr:hypothetical protein [Gemmatimonadaceae bacterium]